MTAILENRKFRLMAACQLVILVLCATFFTWARYVITQEGDVYLPTAKSFTASIELGETLDVAVDQLLPGVSDSDTQQITFTILNSKTDETDTETTTLVSETPLEYTINIYSAGNLPLELWLTTADEDGTLSYYAGERRLAVTDGLKEGYQYQFNAVESATDTGLEAVFLLDGGVLDQETFTLHFIWEEDSDTATLTTGEGLSSHERYQKELEVLEIRAVIVAGEDHDTV